MTTEYSKYDPRLSFLTLVDVINHHVRENPDHEVFTWLDNTGKEANKMTYKKLDDESTAVAAMLLKKGCKKGDRVMIAYPFGLEFFAAILGAIKARLVPCSIYPPNPRQLNAELAKFKRFARDAGAKYALTTAKFAVIMKAASFVAPTGVKWLPTDNLGSPTMSDLKKLHAHMNKHAVDTEDIAFVQYTSGSTGFPKGVALSHRAVLENCRCVTETCKADITKTAVIWLPQYHDMGLVGGYLTCFYSGCALKAMSPLDFLSNPLLWNEMIMKYQANVAASPNFGCALLLRRLKQANVKRADWSCVDRIILGAEPLTKEVVQGLRSVLKMRPDAISNVFGLAETGVWITGSVANLDTMVDDTHINCGPAICSHAQVRIVQDKTRIVSEGEVGNIFAQTTTVATCYHGQKELTAKAFHNTLEGEEGYWLDTGDLGTIVNGELYVVGREKDVIIVAGKNHYPTDIEATINNAHAAEVKSGRIAAFQMDAETIGIAMEHRQTDVSKDCKLHHEIAALVSLQHGLEVSSVVILKPGKIPKTTSGKLRRFLIKQKTMDKKWSPGDILLSLDRPESQGDLRSSTFLERSFSARGFSNDTRTMSKMQLEVSQEISKSFRCPFSGASTGGSAIPANISPFTIGVAHGTAAPSDAVLGMAEFYKGASSKTYKHHHLTETATIDYQAVVKELPEYERARECGEITRSYDLGLTMLPNRKLWTDIPGCQPFDIVFALDKESHEGFRSKTVASLSRAPSLEGLRLDIRQFLSESRGSLSYDQIRQWSITVVYQIFTKEELSLGEVKEVMALQGFTFDAMMRPQDNQTKADESMLQLKAKLLRSTMDRMGVAEYHASAIIDLLVFAGAQISTLINNCLSLMLCENKFFDGSKYELDGENVRQFVWECIRLFPLVGGIPWYDGETRHVAVIDMCGRDKSLWGNDVKDFRPNRCTADQFESRSCFFAEQAGKYGCPAKEFALDATCSFLLEAMSIDWERSTSNTYDTLPYFDRIALKQKKHIVVVGGGMAGLVCALRLAEGGKVKVTVIEKNDSIGGHACHAEVFDGNLRNPAFGAFTEREWPNLVALTEELGVERVRLGRLQKAATRIAFDGHEIPEAPEVEVRRFLADMLEVYQSHSANSMETSLGEFLDGKGYAEDFIVTFVIGRMTFFFAGQTIQEYLDYPVYHFAWFVVALMMVEEDVGIFRLNNREYTRAIEARLNTLGVELLTGTDATLESRDGPNGVRLTLETNVGANSILADKMVVAMPPNAASAFLGQDIKGNEVVLNEFRCPSETVVLHKDPKWADHSAGAFMFATLPDQGAPLPSRDQTVPLTTSMICDNDGHTKIYSTHSYQNFKELDITGPKKYFSFVHTKLNTEAIVNRRMLQKLQAQNNTYFVGGWTTGFMLHEDALLSGIGAANSILESLGMPTRPVLTRATPMLEQLSSSSEMGTDQPKDRGTMESQFVSMLEHFLGPNIDVTKPWAEFGLSSIKAVELANRIRTDFLVSIPPDFDQVYPTPEALLNFLLQDSGTAKPFPIKMDNIGKPLGPPSLPWSLAKCMHLLGCLTLLFLVAISLVPPYLFATSVANVAPLMLPMMIPVWYISFSMLLVACKWIVIGRYTAKTISIPSIDYLRWWLVDRLVHIWETWVGAFIKGTLFISITYKLMGASIPASASIDTFLREHDLIKVGSEATIEFPINCRKFSPWTDTDGPTLRFRPIEIGNKCKIYGQVEPGVSVGDESCVEKLSSVSEGAMVPSGATAFGSPALQIETVPEGNSNRHWLAMGLSKVLLLFLQLYLASGQFLIANMIVPSPLWDAWRYGTFARLALVVVVQAILMVLSTIPAKWLLIGKRRPGPARTSVVGEVMDWFADYNFRVGWMMFDSLGANSIFVTPLLKLLGLDVDLDSKVWAAMYPPSKVDLIKVKNSFVSSTEFRTKRAGEYAHVYLEDSNIGHTVVIEAGGPPIHSETISPMSYLPADGRATSKTPTQMEGLTTPFHTKIYADFFALIFAALILLSLLPTVEVWNGIGRGMESGVACWMLQVVSAIIVQSSTLYITIIVVQVLLYPNVKHGVLKMSSWQAGFLQVYFSFIHFCWMRSFLHVMWGSPLFGTVLKGLGANVEGQLLYFGGLLDDYPRISFADRTIVDSAQKVAGHFGVRGEITLGQTHLAGLIHPHTLALGNTQMRSEKKDMLEVGPMAFITPSFSSAIADPNTNADITQSDIENQMDSTPSESAIWTEYEV